MDEVIRRLNAGAARYLLIGGQAVRLEGLPRFSLDWDLFIPGKDQANIEAINRIMGDALDAPLVALGPRGENFVQTYQTEWGILQFHLGGPGLPPFDQAEARSVTRHTEHGVPVKCLCIRDLLESKRKANRPCDAADIAFLEAKEGLRGVTG